MSPDKYPSIFPRQMEAIVYIFVFSVLDWSWLAVEAHAGEYLH